MKRRRLWLPLLIGLAALLLCGMSLFRQVGPLELAVVLVPVALVVIIESGRYIVRQFLKGYRGRPGSKH